MSESVDCKAEHAEHATPESEGFQIHLLNVLAPWALGSLHKC